MTSHYAYKMTQCVQNNTCITANPVPSIEKLTIIKQSLII